MRRVSTRTLVVTGLVVSLLVAGVLSLYASRHPDGLEYVASHTGFLDTADDSASSSAPLSGYGRGGSALSQAASGVIGVVVVGALAFGLARLLRRRPEKED